jgi:hypothetical protein
MSQSSGFGGALMQPLGLAAPNDRSGRAVDHWQRTITKQLRLLGPAMIGQVDAGVNAAPETHRAPGRPSSTRSAAGGTAKEDRQLTHVHVRV